MRRVAVNIGTWDPTVSDWDCIFSLLDPLEPTETARCRRFARIDDKKRSIVGRLTLRAMLAEHTGIGFAQVELKRTKENKPVCGQQRGGGFNVSE